MHKYFERARLERSIDLLPITHFSIASLIMKSNASFFENGVNPDIYKRSPQSHIRDYDRDLFKATVSKENTSKMHPEYGTSALIIPREKRGTSEWLKIVF